LAVDAAGVQAGSGKANAAGRRLDVVRRRQAVGRHALEAAKPRAGSTGIRPAPLCAAGLRCVV